MTGPIQKIVRIVDASRSNALISNTAVPIFSPMFKIRTIFTGAPALKILGKTITIITIHIVSSN